MLFHVLSSPSSSVFLDACGVDDQAHHLLDRLHVTEDTHLWSIGTSFALTSLALCSLEAPRSNRCHCLPSRSLHVLSLDARHWSPHDVLVNDQELSSSKTHAVRSSHTHVCLLLVVMVEIPPPSEEKLVLCSLPGWPSPQSYSRLSWQAPVSTRFPGCASHRVLSLPKTF